MDYKKKMVEVVNDKFLEFKAREEFKNYSLGFLRSLSIPSYMKINLSLAISLFTNENEYLVSKDFLENMTTKEFDLWIYNNAKKDEFIYD